MGPLLQKILINTNHKSVLHTVLTVAFVFFFDVEGLLSDPLASSDWSNCSSSSSLSGFRLGMVGKILASNSESKQNRVAYQCGCHRRVTEYVTRQVATPASAVVPLQVCFALDCSHLRFFIFCSSRTEYHFQHHTSYTATLYCSHFPWVSPGK